jgi:hypothetical protein
VHGTWCAAWHHRLYLPRTLGEGCCEIRPGARKPAASREEAYALARALKEIGEPHLGAAALICFESHQRPEHVRNGDITWADYRPGHRPDAVQIRHPKTGEKGWVPLEDSEGLLFPELEVYLAELPRLGLPIVLTAGRRGPARPYSDEYAQRKVREARARAGLHSHVTLDACRHGGLTELGDAGATEFEGMAASMHRTRMRCASTLNVPRPSGYLQPESGVAWLMGMANDDQGKNKNGDFFGMTRPERFSESMMLG